MIALRKQLGGRVRHGVERAVQGKNSEKSAVGRNERKRTRVKLFLKREKKCKTCDMQKYTQRKAKEKRVKEKLHSGHEFRSKSKSREELPAETS